MKEKITDSILVLVAIVSFFLSIQSGSRAGATMMNGSALYGAHCSRCHGPLSPSSRVSTGRIEKAISTVNAMRPLSVLSTPEVEAIAAALTTTASSPLPRPVYRSSLELSDSPS